MSYKTHDYQCEGCAHAEIVMLKRDEEPLPQECPECGGVMIRLFGSPTVLNHSHRDGNGRFEQLKRNLEHKRVAAEAKSRGDFETERKARKEIK